MEVIPKLHDDKDNMYCFKHKKYTCRCGIIDKLNHYKEFEAKHPELKDEIIKRNRESNSRYEFVI